VVKVERSIGVEEITKKQSPITKKIKAKGAKRKAIRRCIGVEG